MARHAMELIVTGCWDLYFWIVPSPRITWRLAGHTVISLHSMKGVPSRKSTSRFSSPSKVNVWFL